MFQKVWDNWIQSLFISILIVYVVNKHEWVSDWKSLSHVWLFVTNLQVRILEWVAFPCSRGSSQLRDQTQVSCIAGRFFTSWATRESHAMQETWVWSLGWKEPLEKEIATHSSILAYKITGTGEPGRLQFMGSQRVRHDWAIKHSTAQVACISSQL